MALLNRFSLRARAVRGGLLTAVFWAARLEAQEMELPVAAQIPLFLKVASFDRQARPADHARATFAIAYQGGNRVSTAAKDAATRAFREKQQHLHGLAMAEILIDLDRESLADAIARHRVAVLWVAPLRSIRLADIVAVAQRGGVLTVTGVTDYVAQGIVVGVRIVADRPKLIVNLPSMRASGADFPAQLLKLAHVLQ
jgi:hypothetical protein